MTGTKTTPQELADEVHRAIDAAEAAYDQVAEGCRSRVSDPAIADSVDQIINAGRDAFLHEARQVAWAHGAQVEPHVLNRRIARALWDLLREVAVTKASYVGLPGPMAPLNVTDVVGEEQQNALAQVNDVMGRINATTKEFRKHTVTKVWPGFVAILAFYMIEFVTFVGALTIVSELVENNLLPSRWGWVATVGGVAAGVLVAAVVERALRKALRTPTINIGRALQGQLQHRRFDALYLQLAYLDDAAQLAGPSTE